MSQTLDLGTALEEGAALLRLPSMTRDEFWEFCQRNRDLRIERTAEGDLIIMPPAGSETGSKNNEIGRQLGNWNLGQGEPGYVFDSSTGFTLPSGAIRSPDASWVRHSRWDALTTEQREKIAPLCPDFVVELMSPSDSLSDAQTKMEEYRANGARLGWLIDRRSRQVQVYRPGQSVQVLDDPAEVSADPELPGFVLDMRRIF